MEKDFQGWIEKKETIDRERSAPRFHEREVWWCAIGTNVGAEADGKNEWRTRPVLVVKKFNRQMAWVVPVTSTDHQGSQFYARLTHHDKTSYAVLSQLRLISSKRFLRMMYKVPSPVMAEIRQRLQDFLE